MAAADSDLRLANPIAPEIRAALAGLRWRIRAYIVVEGIAAATIWLGAAFWLSLAFDYLPILAGASELPRPVRAALLVVTAAGALGLIYWYVLRRVVVRLADRSMAVLLERRYREFGDSLLTAVEMAELPERTETFNPVMLDATKRLAERKIPEVRLRNLFNFRPLAWRLVAAWRWRRASWLSPARTPRSSRKRLSGCGCYATNPGRGAQRSKWSASNCSDRTASVKTPKCPRC